MLDCITLQDYMSPELLASGTKPLGQPLNAAAADVWALGICLFLMVSGVYPFEACARYTHAAPLRARLSSHQNPH